MIDHCSEECASPYCRRKREVGSYFCSEYCRDSLFKRALSYPNDVKVQQEFKEKYSKRTILEEPYLGVKE
jgi:hypothetical protein